MCEIQSERQREWAKGVGGDAIKLCPHLEVVRSEVSSLLACKNNQLHKRFKMIIKIKMVVMMLYDFITVWSVGTDIKKQSKPQTTP